MRALFVFFLIFGIFGFCQEMNFKEKEEFINTLEKEISSIESNIKKMKENFSKTSEEEHDFVEWVIQKDASCERIVDVLLNQFLRKNLLSDENDLNQKLRLVQLLIFEATKLKMSIDTKILEEIRKNFEDLKDLMKTGSYKKRYLKEKSNS